MERRSGWEIWGCGVKGLVEEEGSEEGDALVEHLDGVGFGGEGGDELFVFRGQDVGVGFVAGAVGLGCVDGVGFFAFAFCGLLRGLCGGAVCDGGVCAATRYKVHADHLCFARLDCIGELLEAKD